jgi:hypothetical protein
MDPSPSKLEKLTLYPVMVPNFVLVGELVTVTYAIDVSVKVAEVVCAKAPFFTVEIIVSEKRSVDVAIDQRASVSVNV